MTINIQRAIDVLGRFGHLQPEQAESVMNQIMQGEATDAQIGAYLMALRMKGETQNEIVGRRCAFYPKERDTDHDCGH